MSIPQRSTEWYRSRIGMITGSRVAAILGISPWQTRDGLLRHMVREYHGAEPEFTGNPATRHGQMHEREAILKFTRVTGLHVEECGLFVYGELLAASPDGLVGDDAVLEIKVPYSRKIGPVPDYYEVQVQMEMLCADRDKCYFFQYVPAEGDPFSPDYKEEEYRLDVIHRDPDWLDKHKPALDDFYDLYKSELSNPEHLEPLRVQVEAPDIVDEIMMLRDRQKADKAREADLLMQLVELAGEKDAEVSGRKLTRVVRAGAVDYAKVPELKGVDLDKWRKKASEFWRLT